jgi:guanylate kinase
MAEAKPQIFIVSGPSGSGKSTVVGYILQEIPSTLFSVSHTTRPPRAGEVEGKDYFYVSQNEFDAMIDRNEFLEHDHHFAHFYGTHLDNLSRAAEQQKDLLLDIDIEGARQIKEKIPEAVAILFIPPSREELERRLRGRGQEDEADEAAIQRRLERARQEISQYQGYDYLVVNEKLEDAKAQVYAILCLERRQHGQGKPGCEKMNEDLAARAAEARRENNNQRVSVILKTFKTPEPNEG